MLPRSYSAQAGEAGEVRQRPDGLGWQSQGTLLRSVMMSVMSQTFTFAEQGEAVQHHVLKCEQDAVNTPNKPQLR